MVDGFLVRELSGKMEDDLRLVCLKRGVERFFVADVTRDWDDAAVDGEMGEQAGGLVIDDDNAVWGVFKKASNEVRADCPCSTGNKYGFSANFHRKMPIWGRGQVFRIWALSSIQTGRFWDLFFRLFTRRCREAEAYA